MKLNLKAAIESLLHGFQNRGEDESGDGPVSIVLLLREPRFLTLEQLRLAGERAFGVQFSEETSARDFVIQKVLFTLMKAGPHTLSFLNYTKPYGAERAAEFASRMSQPGQRQAWVAHTAWTAIDYVKGGARLDLEYAVLSKLCSEMVDGNCLGVYLPREQMMVPHGEKLLPYLRRVGSAVPLGLGQAQDRSGTVH